MKASLFFLLFFPVVCFAQKDNTAYVKSSADDCPNWNKKAPASKAEYFQYLRTHQSSKNQQAVTTTSPTDYQQQQLLAFATPKRQSLLAHTVSNKNTTIASSEKHSAIKQEKIKTADPLPAKENNVPGIADETTTKKGIDTSAPKETKETTTTTDSKTAAKESPIKDHKTIRIKKNRFFSKRNKTGKSNNTKCPSF